ncbi:sigma-70 family RNA polymerase sigma factor [Sphingobium cloacae]|nr:sigma-70 family RNA polymerase sigma factor [Sphingobium cloacae]
MTHESMALRLYRSHRAALVDYAKGITGSRAHAEDVVQEAWFHLDRKGDDPAIREPIAYLYRIVRNLAVDSIRRLLRERTRCGVDIEEAARLVPDESPSAEATIIARDDVRLVFETLEDLPERQRIAIEMYRFGGFKLRQIAERLNVSIALVHLLIAQGLEACDRRRNEE